MPYSLPINAVIEIRIVGQLAGQTCVTTFHYMTNVVEPDGRAVVSSCLEQFENIVWDTFQGTMSNDFGTVTLEGQAIDPLRYQKVVRVPGNASGGVVSASCPSGTSVVIRRSGDRATRYTRGRIYLPAVPFASTTNSQLNVAYVNANAANFRTSMIAPLPYALDANAVPVIWSASSPGRRTPVVDASLDRILRYQRRREVGVGQ